NIDDLVSRSVFDQATKLLQEAAREFPDVENFANQLEVVQKAWKKKTRDDAIASAISRSKQMANGDLDGAISLLEKTEAEYPGDPKIEARLEDLRQTRKKKLRDAEIKALVAQATALYQKQAFDESLRVLGEGSKKFPDDSQLTSLAREVESAKAEHDRRAAVQKALESAEQLRSGGRLKEAAEALERVLSQFPKSPEIQKKLDAIRAEI